MTMRKYITIGSKVGFLDKGKYKWSKVVSIADYQITLEQNNKYKTKFDMNLQILMNHGKNGLVKIITNTKLY